MVEYVDQNIIGVIRFSAKYAYRSARGKVQIVTCVVVIRKFSAGLVKFGLRPTYRQIESLGYFVGLFVDHVKGISRG